MEATKEKWFEAKYDTKTQKMVLKKTNIKSKIIIKKIINSVKNHVFITTLSITFLAFSILNVVMIYNFFEILQKV